MCTSYEANPNDAWDVFAIAGLWRQWKEGEGSLSIAFTMMTVNSDEHLLMKRFHKLGDEKALGCHHSADRARGLVVV
ncbi:hypothetical protein AB4Y32_10180 [Paraburkholderia phymatum]|uniref:Uncharacterized protein n=1 Tax=Paraburkholderia phymatum TaxID=148447 RepID=A0ACC6TXL3_9BURK